MRRILSLAVVAMSLAVVATAHAQSQYPPYVLGLPPSSQMTPPTKDTDQIPIVRDKSHAYRNTIPGMIAGGLQAAMDALFGNVRGSLIYRGAGGWTQLLPGTNGQCLLTGGPNADPSWGNCGTGPPPPTGVLLLTGGNNLLTIGSNLASQ